jgi:hypothetical protein
MFLSLAPPTLKRPLTRRYAPTSPRKRGEVNPLKPVREKSARIFLNLNAR